MRVVVNRSVTLKVEVKGADGEPVGSFGAAFRIPTLDEFKENSDDAVILNRFLTSVSDIEPVDEAGNPASITPLEFVKTDLILSAAAAAAFVHYRGAQFRKPS
jgi:hypothetical protein